MSDTSRLVCSNGHENPPGMRFCGVCGAPLTESALPTPPVPTPDATEPAPSPETTPLKRGKRVWVIVGAPVLILGLVAFGAKAALGHGSKHDLAGFAVAPECGGGYEIENANVELLNQANEIVGASTTSSDLLAGGGHDLCLTSFSISQVPNADLFKLRIGTHDGPIYMPSPLAGPPFRHQRTSAVTPTNSTRRCLTSPHSTSTYLRGSARSRMRPTLYLMTPPIWHNRGAWRTQQGSVAL
jgi:hypothetical protein